MAPRTTHFSQNERWDTPTLGPQVGVVAGGMATAKLDTSFMFLTLGLKGGVSPMASTLSKSTLANQPCALRFPGEISGDHPHGVVRAFRWFGCSIGT